MTLWDHFEALISSAGFYVRACRRIRNSKIIGSIRDFQLSNCINTTILPGNILYLGGLLPADVDGFFDAPFKPLMFIINDRNAPQISQQ